MRKAWLCGMIALVCSSFMLLACDTGVETQELTLKELQQRLIKGYQSLNRSKKTLDPTRVESLVGRLAPPKIAWAKMGKVERERHMARAVMPLMLLFFQAHDDELNGDSGFGSRTPGGRPFSCLTCHGDSATTVVDTRTFDFTTPTHLFPLDPNNMPTETDENIRIARSVRFMKFVITPAIRILLGNKNANCFTCHARKKH